MSLSAVEVKPKPSIARASFLSGTFRWAWFFSDDKYLASLEVLVLFLKVPQKWDSHVMLIEHVFVISLIACAICCSVIQFNVSNCCPCLQRIAYLFSLANMSHLFHRYEVEQLPWPLDCDATCMWVICLNNLRITNSDFRTCPSANRWNVDCFFQFSRYVCMFWYLQDRALILWLYKVNICSTWQLYFIKLWIHESC